MLGRREVQRGDTLIEVLLAVTVFSLIVVGALSVMNQGSAASRRALETTIAREAIDGQAETLRFLHESYVAAYQSGTSYNVSDSVTTPAEEYSRIIANAIAYQKDFASDLDTGMTCPAAAPPGSFVVDPAAGAAIIDPGRLAPASLYPQLEYGAGGSFTRSSGLWIEAVRPAGVVGASNAGTIDFHIRACWRALGSNVPVTIGTIVRLYEPRG